MKEKLVVKAREEERDVRITIQEVQEKDEHAKQKVAALRHQQRQKVEAMMARQDQNKTRAQMNMLEKMQEQQQELHEKMEGVLARIHQKTEIRDSQLDLRNNWAREHNLRQKHRSLQNA